MRDGYEAMKEYLESVNLLIAAAAKKKAWNMWGRTPLQQAAYVRHNCYKSGNAYFKLQEGEKAEKEKALKRFREILYSQGQGS